MRLAKVLAKESETLTAPSAFPLWDRGTMVVSMEVDADMEMVATCPSPSAKKV